MTYLTLQLKFKTIMYLNIACIYINMNTLKDKYCINYVAVAESIIIAE